MDRSKALVLLEKYVTNINLRRHMFSVEVGMRAYARKYHQDESWWGIAGLLHDFDYEQYPDPKDHPDKGCAILKTEGYDQEFISTIRAHAAHTGEPRNTLAKKAIYAIDELTGLIVATALVQPNKKLSEVDARSVKKKMKNTAFARQVNRNEIITGAAELGVTLDEHIELVLRAMQSVSNSLGL